MKNQFAAPIKDRFGQELKDVDLERSVPGQPPIMKPLTLGDICCNVLDMTFQDEANEGLKPKLRRGELMEKITQAERTLTPLELLDADRELLKERIGKRGFSTTLTVQAVRLLDTPVGAAAATPEPSADTPKESPTS